MDEKSDEEVNSSVDVERPSEPTTLHRSGTKKIFGGVAGGISERFDVDVNIVRVVFVVLTLIYGLGAAIYLAMWVLIPRAATIEGEQSGIIDEDSGKRFHWLRYAVPVGVIVLALMFLATFRGNLKVGSGLSLVWVLFVVVLAIMALRIPARRLTLRRFLALSFLALMSFVIFVVGAALVALQVIGVPLKGGGGVHVWHPVTVSEVQRQYHGAIGQSTVDLANVPFGSKTYSITATQGVGELIVDIPSNIVVDLRTHVGIGDVQQEMIPTHAVVGGTSTSHTHEGHLILNLQVGVGVLQIFRYVHY